MPENSLATPPAKRRRWYQFSLRTLIVFMALVSILLGLFAIRLQRAREQAQAVAALRSYGYVQYDCQWRLGDMGDELEITWEPTPKSAVPSLLIDWLGRDFFQNATFVCIRLPELPANGSEDGRNAVWEHLGRLHALEYLSMDLEGGGETKFTRLRRTSNLRHLSVRGTFVRVSADDLRSLKRLSKLQSLNLRDCVFEHGSFETIGQLPSLIQLELPESNVEDGDLALLSRRQGLRALDLSRTNISDEALRSVGALGQLETLELDNTHISDNGISYLRELSTLRSISLSNTSITDAGVHHLEKLPGLKSIDLCGTKVKGMTPSGFRRIERIDLSKTDVADEALIAIANLPAIQHVDVSGTMVTILGERRFRALRPEVALSGITQ